MHVTIIYHDDGDGDVPIIARKMMTTQPYAYNDSFFSMDGIIMTSSIMIHLMKMMMVT